MNVYLIGYRGTGKSTVAPLLAVKLGPAWDWIDLDVELEKRAGRTIAQIFESDGEAVFRDLEQQELERAALRERLVVATGGGVIGREKNRTLLRKGWVAWLTAPAEVILDRVSNDAKTQGRRPNLTVHGGLAEIERLLAERTPVYDRLADIAVSTVDSTADELVERIAAAFQGSVR